LHWDCVAPQPASGHFGFREPLPIGEPAADACLATLSFREVAAQWGVAIDTFNGRHFGPLGSFRPGLISLGVQNMATWCHELVHAADHRNGKPRSRTR
jgi:hypothetical protein